MKERIAFVPPADRWVSLKEVSAHLGITRETVLAWVREKGLPAFKAGCAWRFKLSEVDAWMDSYRVVPQNSKMD